MGGEGSGPRTKFSDEYHQVLRKNVKESRERSHVEKPCILEKLILLHLKNEADYPTAKLETKNPVAKTKTVKTKDVTVTVFSPVKPVSSRFVENMVLKYGYLHSKKQIEESARLFAHHNVTELKKLLKQEMITANGIIFIKFHEEKKKAKMLLHRAGFGHADPYMNTQNLKPHRESVALREELWVNIMDHLRSEDVHYFVAKKTADDMAFPLGSLNYTDPYQYRDPENFLIKHSLVTIKPLSNPSIKKWREEPGEQKLTKLQLNVLIKDQEAEEAKQRHINSELNRVRPQLIENIEYGYFDAHILAQYKQSGWGRMMLEIFAYELKKLRKEGHKPKESWKVEAKVVEEKK